MEWFKAAEKFNQALSSSDPVPGGGAAAAMTAAMGCSLALMAAGTTLLKKSTAPEVKTRLEQAMRKLGAFKTRLIELVQEDGAAYSAYIVAKKLPKEDPGRARAMQDALVYAARVPADTAATALHCLKEVQIAQPDIAPVILSDAHCARHLLQSALRCCIENIQANLAFIQDEALTEKLRKQIETFAKSC